MTRKGKARKAKQSVKANGSYLDVSNLNTTDARQRLPIESNHITEIYITNSNLPAKIFEQQLRCLPNLKVIVISRSLSLITVLDPELSFPNIRVLVVSDITAELLCMLLRIFPNLEKLSLETNTQIEPAMLDNLEPLARLKELVVGSEIPARLLQKMPTLQTFSACSSKEVLKYSPEVTSRLFANLQKFHSMSGFNVDLRVLQAILHPGLKELTLFETIVSDGLGTVEPEFCLPGLRSCQIGVSAENRTLVVCILKAATNLEKLNLDCSTEFNKNQYASLPILNNLSDLLVSRPACLPCIDVADLIAKTPKITKLELCNVTVASHHQLGALKCLEKLTIERHLSAAIDPNALDATWMMRFLQLTPKLVSLDTRNIGTSSYLRIDMSVFEESPKIFLPELTCLRHSNLLTPLVQAEILQRAPKLNCVSLLMTCVSGLPESHPAVNYLLIRLMAQNSFDLGDTRTLAEYRLRDDVIRLLQKDMPLKIKMILLKLINAETKMYIFGHLFEPKYIETKLFENLAERNMFRYKRLEIQNKLTEDTEGTLALRNAAFAIPHIFNLVLSYLLDIEARQTILCNMQSDDNKIRTRLLYSLPLHRKRTLEAAPCAITSASSTQEVVAQGCSDQTPHQPPKRARPTI